MSCRSSLRRWLVLSFRRVQVQIRTGSLGRSPSFRLGVVPTAPFPIVVHVGMDLICHPVGGERSVARLAWNPSTMTAMARTRWEELTISQLLFLFSLLSCSLILSLWHLPSGDPGTVSPSQAPATSQGYLGNLAGCLLSFRSLCACYRNIVSRHLP